MADDGCVIRLRGLPWSATQAEVVDFLRDVDVKDGKNGVHFTLTMDGRPSGDAFVELESQRDVDKSNKLHKEKLGHRYIEVFTSNLTEMNFVIKRGNLAMPTMADSGSGHYVKLRGLPYESTKKDIIHFFSDADIDIPADHIMLTLDGSGRPTGEAFVQFSNEDIAQTAIEKKNRDRIAHRYIEMFMSSAFEARQAELSGTAVMNMQQRGMTGRSTPYDRMGGGGRYGGGGGGRMSGGGGMGRRGGSDGSYMMDSGGKYKYMTGRSSGGRSQSGHLVHMRGLPYRCTERDIISFFSPLSVENVKIELDYMGRPSGEAEVDFQTHDDAVKAMSRDRQNLGHRYIELFLTSSGGR